MKTLCEVERDEPVSLGSSRVECEHDGSFKPMQCSAVESECWCVDGLGHEVPKTRTPVYIVEHKPNCGMSSWWNVIIHPGRIAGVSICLSVCSVQAPK